MISKLNNKDAIQKIPVILKIFSHQNFLAFRIFWLYDILQHVASVWFILLEAIFYAHFMVETSTFSYLAS